MLDTVLQNISLPAMPPGDILLGCCLAAIVAAMILAGVFSPFFAIAGELLAIRTKRAFYVRVARQIAQMALAVGIAAALLAGAAFTWFAMGQPALLAAPYALPLAVTGGVIVIALLVLAVYIRMRPAKGLAEKEHLAVGVLAALCTALSLFCSIGAVRRLIHTPPDFATTLPWTSQVMLFFGIPADSFFWPLLVESVPLGFAFAAAFGCVWLLLMRDRQDYGRDYYAFALPYCARWASVSTLLAVAAGVFVSFESRKIMLPELSQEPSLLLDILTAVLPLLACLLWFLVSRSAHPMRRKLSVVLACLFLLSGFAGQMLMLNKVVPSP